MKITITDDDGVVWAMHDISQHEAQCVDRLDIAIAEGASDPYEADVIDVLTDVETAIRLTAKNGDVGKREG